MQVPQLLAGRYAIERELGRGGMAVVYLARDQRHRRDVAVKVFRMEGGPLDGPPRFLHEIEVAARLAHPNILPLHDSGEDKDLIYYVMPYVPGENLRQRLEREGALPLTDAIAIAAQVAGALAYAHSHGVIHRDIKPENILFIAGQAVVADFGIARAISAGGWDELELGRGPLGTPAYMSPEQGQHSSRVDGRSDLYSLGCVLYEMLTGVPPFRGSTPEELMVQHLEAPPEPVQIRRPALTPELESLVGKVLAKHPADRYQTAQQFSDALAGIGHGRITSGPSMAAVAPAPPPSPGWFRRLGLPGLAATAVVYAVYIQVPSDAAWSWRPGDASVHLVAPFVHRDGAAPQLLSGNQCSRLVQAALARWADVRVVDARWASDQFARLGHEPTIDDLLTIARHARAGRLISGEVYRFRDSIQVHGVLYDVRRRGRVLREYTVTLGGEMAGADRRFAELTDSLLLPPATTAAATGGAMGTRSVASWLAYDSGHAALGRWDLPAATRYFATAVTLDPGYGLAHLWLAQTGSWSGAPAGIWRDDALAGLGAQPSLLPRDHEWALSLVALAKSRFPEACDQYEAMLRRDSLDFRGWYGRAECRSRDPVVLKDGNSPSGWRFRSSYQAALDDYQHALLLIPSVHQAFRGAAFARLVRLYYAEPNVFRRGTLSDTLAPTFAAFPSIEGDTLAFVPWPSERVGEASSRARSGADPEAITRNLRRLGELTAGWCRAFPSSSAAIEADAMVLELAGEFGSTTGAADSAVRRIRQARRLTTDSTDQVRLGSVELRLLVKRERFRDAARLADSLLAANPAPTPAAAPFLAAAAALTGRASLAAELARRSAPAAEFWAPTGAVLSIPLPLRETALALEAAAAIGAPRDSLRWLYAQAGRQLDASVPRNRRPLADAALLDQSRVLLFPNDFAAPPARAGVPMNYQLELQQAVRRDEAARARGILANLASLRVNHRSGTVAVEAILAETIAELALGDTAGATARLDDYLDGLAQVGLDLTERSVASGALVRVMALRARLAAATGDRQVAARWASNVLALWEKADPGLSPVRDEMRAIAARPS